MTTPELWARSHENLKLQASRLWVFAEGKNPSFFHEVEKLYLIAWWEITNYPKKPSRMLGLSLKIIF